MMEKKVMSCALRGRGGESGERGSWSHRLELGEERVSNALDSVQKDYLLMEIQEMGKIYKIRKLTSRECLRLMGVSDGDIDRIKEAGISETQQYKMAGNSIVVPVLEAIFTQMFRKDGDALF
jgi:site-specific DNA-cytosine methylase